MKRKPTIIGVAQCAHNICRIIINDAIHYDATHLLGRSHGTTDKDNRSRFLVELESTHNGLSLLTAGHGNIAIHDAELGRRTPVVGSILKDAGNGIHCILGMTQDGIVCGSGFFSEKDFPEFEFVGRCCHVDAENLLGHHPLEELVGKDCQRHDDERFFVLIQSWGFVAFGATLGGGFDLGHFVEKSINCLFLVVRSLIVAC